MNKMSALAAVENKRNMVFELSEAIWADPELLFHEFNAAKLYCELLRAEGFRVEEGIYGMPTAFLAEFGSGKPVVAFLSEYDALPNLDQESCLAMQRRREKVGNVNGHGCGHNLLGAGSLTAALLVKDYLEKSGIPGTIRLYGTPAEEGGMAKCFMVRDGAFDDVDACLAWHPENVNFVMPNNHLAIIQAQYRFCGRSAHAAMAPHLGRSALDAVELMNIGVNFLREHVISDARIHYAIVDAGGPASNVVQENAQVNYTVRAPKSKQCKEILARVNKVAEGAAMMTETEVEIAIDSGIANTITNITLDKVIYKNFLELGLPPVDDCDREFAQAIRDMLPPEQLDYEIERAETYFGAIYAQNIARNIKDKPVCEYLYPYKTSERIFFGSTDVGDVTQVIPTAQLGTACFAQGTPYHTWMMTSQANAPLAKKAMFHAGKVLGATAIDLYEKPELLKEAWVEFKQITDGEKYESIIPRDKKPG